MTDPLRSKLLQQQEEILALLQRRKEIERLKDEIPFNGLSLLIHTRLSREWIQVNEAIWKIVRDQPRMIRDTVQSQKTRFD